MPEVSASRSTGWVAFAARTLAQYPLESRVDALPGMRISTGDRYLLQAIMCSSDAAMLHAQVASKPH
eukprot:2888870-Pleurochrysis_carterae.AAC.3